MGYTIYWKQVSPVSQAVWDTFVHRALHLVKRRRTGEIRLENTYARPVQKNVFRFEGAPEEERGETFYVAKELDNKGYSFCKTNRYPYTTDVFICLILMFDLGMLKGFSSDDMNEQYPEALAYVKENYALKRSYERLRVMGRHDDDENNTPAESPAALSQRPRKQRTRKATSRALRAKKRAASKRAASKRAAKKTKKV